MSIKCSLLGHRFDETSVEREREEEGSEVVITITELESCSRCGETRVVSENKEVTTLETPDDGGRASGDAPAARGADDDRHADYDPDGDDAEILDAEGAESDAQATARSASIPDAEGAGPGDAQAAPNSHGEASVDDEDAVIMDDDAPVARETGVQDGRSGPAADAAGREQPPEPGEGGADREPGEWPDAEESSAVAEAGGGVADNSNGAWPEETRGPESGGYEAWPEETHPDESADEPDVGPTLEESASPTITVPEGMFKCSNCGFTTEVESSSLRAGDFCPECRQGTLVQDEGTESGD